MANFCRKSTRRRATSVICSRSVRPFFGSLFFCLAHLLVLLLNFLGMPIAANGFSFPYLVAMALGTAIYGFLGLLLSFSLARKYVGEQWAFLATVGIWWGSSLPVYMYFNPAWSHAHSAFAVALFLWYWDRTRPARTTSQWLILGLISGLMVDIYFPNGVFLFLPLIESLVGYAAYLKSQPQAARKLFLQNLIFVLTICFAFLPTIITRRIIFGGYFRFGSYSHLSWDWSAPHWLSVLFSSNHGLFSWTPLLALALIGLFFTPRAARILALYFAVAVAAFYYLISSYPFWHGMASFGNRFFISLTPIYVFGLAALLLRFAELLSRPRLALLLSSGILGCFVLWNLGMIYQWGAHLVPVRGPISFREAVHNQFYEVPRQLSGHLRYLCLSPQRSDAPDRAARYRAAQERLPAMTAGARDLAARNRLPVLPVIVGSFFLSPPDQLWVAWSRNSWSRLIG